MTVDFIPALEERDVRLRSYEFGEHHAPCPDYARGPRGDSRASPIDQDGSATWLRHTGLNSGSIDRRGREPLLSRPAL